MLKSMKLQDFTVFHEAEFTFGTHLNIVVGDNGAGKSHVLKAAYSAIAVSAARTNGGNEPVGKSQMQTAFADKLQSVFRPDGLGRLVRRQKGRKKCSLEFAFDETSYDAEFAFSTLAKNEVTLKKTPKKRIEKLPVFLPTRELLAIYPGFVSLYETTHLSFEETWRDTCILLGAPLARGPREARIKELLEPLEAAMDGSVELDKSGRFYLNLNSGGSMEMHLVAEGMRKLAMVARLVATGSLLDKGYLFWDEPEANLNPKIIKTIARTILQIAGSGIQVFVATHSLFLLRELHVLQKREFSSFDTRCFGLHIGSDGAVTVQQGNTMDDIGEITALDEDLQQSERYIDTEMKVPISLTTEDTQEDA
ncbi:MAG: ATP-binding protein [Planctomycetota bacterium]|nr:ATP-binding protein [Planctomycetota bacterium]